MKLIPLLSLGLLVSIATAAPKVGVLLKDKSGFWASMEKGAAAAAQSAGLEIIVRAPLSESDSAVQAKLLQALLAQDVKAIVVAAINPDGLRAPLAEAMKKGIKVVLIDSAFEGLPGSVFVGTDQLAAGKAAGQLVAGFAQGKDPIGLLRHTQNNPATTQRENGAIEVLREKVSGVVIYGEVYAATEKGEELQKAKYLLSQHPGMKAVIASGTAGTLALMQALQEANNTKLPVVGFGYNFNAQAADAMKKGILRGWVAQLPEEVGRRGIECAASLLKGDKVEPVNNVPFMVITPEKLSDPAVQAFLR